MAVVPAADAQALPEGVTPTMVQEGQAIYSGDGICYTCHGPDGTGGFLAPDLTTGEWIHIDGSFPQIVDLVIEGVAEPVMHPGPMPARGGTMISDEQVRAVAAYVWTLAQGDVAGG
jgi:mono/diheme cytochrome c family protein